jgi:hypothetical protein
MPSDDDEDEEEEKTDDILMNTNKLKSEEKQTKESSTTAAEEPKTYNCTECSKVFKYQGSLDTHYRCQHVNGGIKPTSFACKQCDKVYEKNYQLNMHIKSHDKVPCPECLKMFSKVSLKSHMESVHVDHTIKPFQCLDCDFASHSKQNLRSHQMTCHNDCERPKLECPKCKKCFKHETSLKLHACYGAELSSRCDICESNFKGPQHLVRHYKKLHKKLPPWAETCQQYLCEICSEVFFRPRTLREHIQTKHHAEGGLKTMRKTKPESFECPECHREFNHVSNLGQHYKFAHGGTLPLYEGKEKFICDQCPSEFFAKSSLIRHQDNHHSSDQSGLNGLKKCPHCDMKFAAYGCLNEHVQAKHLGSTPFECDECHRSYGTKFKLQSHKKNTHEKQKCNICGQEICNAFVLRRHKASVHGIVPENVYKCEHCPLFFSKESAKTKHSLKQHADKMQTCDF